MVRVPAIRPRVTTFTVLNGRSPYGNGVYYRNLENPVCEFCSQVTVCVFRSRVLQGKYNLISPFTQLRCIEYTIFQRLGVYSQILFVWDKFI